MRLRIARKIARVSREPLSAPTPYTDAQEGQAARRLHRWWCSRPPLEEGAHRPYPPEWYARNRLVSRARRHRHLWNSERRRRGEEEIPLPTDPLWGSLHPFSRMYR